MSTELVAEHAEQFAAALAAVNGQPRLCGSRAEAEAVLRELCAGRTVYLERHPDLAGLEPPDRLVEDPWAADVGVTGVLAAAAQTGTLALVAGPDTPRSASLVPPVHVALVPHARLVAGFPELVGILDALDPTPSGMQFITGPSKSGDIEMRLIVGMHGPRELHVLLYPG